LSRVIGPVLAGALLAASGAAAVFVLNAALALVAFVLVLRWKNEARTSALPGERFVGAMRVGFNFALQSPRLKVVLLRVFLFFLQSTALMALLPLVALRMPGGDAATFTVMLSCFGLGAIVAALLFPRWRQRFNRNQFVAIGTVVHAVLSCAAVLWPTLWLALPLMLVMGMAWISVANSLAVAAQMAMPDWVRARGMAMYQMALMGGAAAGSLLWGQVAAWFSITSAVLAAAGLGVMALMLTRKLSVEGGEEMDFSPAAVRVASAPTEPVDADAGPVMVTVEYHIDPTRAADFAAVMQRTRRARLRQGALSWGLFRDVAAPGRYIEYFVDENWLEHQRRLERFTAFDAGLREERLAFHLGPEAPELKRYVADEVAGSTGPPL
jgi:Transmembrane secretion effector